MTENEETLRDIAQSYAPSSRRKGRTAACGAHMSALDEHLKEMIDTLFRNAKKNCQKLEEIRVKRNAKAKVSGPRVKQEGGKIVIDYGEMVDAIRVGETTEEADVIVEHGGRSTCRKKRYSERWSLEETELFYTALRLFGTDFELISMCLNNRNRKNIKSKYKKESKINSVSVLFALENRVPLKCESYLDFVQYLKNNKPP